MKSESEDAMENRKLEAKLLAKFPLAGNLPAVAKEHGLKGVFIEYQEQDLGKKNKNVHNGIYFALCRDDSAEKSLYTLLYMEKEKFRELVEKSNRNNRVMNTRINLIFLGNVTPETDLLLYQNCIRRIHDIAAVKAAYGEQGYHPPEYITKETVSVIHSFIEKRYGENISREMRDIQAEAMKKFIVGSVERYRKNLPLRHKILHPKEVRRNYFFKNHVSCVNDAITEEFFEYLKVRMKECPGFLYYRENRPFQSMEVSGSEQKRYRIAYPAAYEELYDGWKLDFVAQTYGWDKSFIVPVEALDRSREFRLVEIDAADAKNWAALCVANHVDCAVNHGEFGFGHSRNSYGFIYSSKDEVKVKGIKERIARETTEYPKEYIVPGELWHLSREQLKRLEDSDRKYRSYLESKEVKREHLKNALSRFFGKGNPEKGMQQEEMVKGGKHHSGYDVDIS